MKPQIIVFSHRRSGTHLVIDAICQNFSNYSDSIPAENTFIELFRGKDNKEFERAKAAVKIKSNVFFSHLHDLDKIDNYFENDPDVLAFYRELIANSKLIYVQRDGKDVMVSMYEWMKATNFIDSNTSFSEFIRQENNWEAPAIETNSNRVAFWANHVKSWSQRKNILQLNFEDLLSDFDSKIDEIATHIEETKPNTITNSKRKPFLGFIPYGKWTRRIKKYSIDLIIKPKSHAHFFRKGQKGDFKNYFNDSDLDFFYLNTKG